MCDRHLNFKDLSRAERLDEDYSIEWRDRTTRVVIAAPHGGGIEPGTSEIAFSVARDDFSYYLFKGLKNSGNSKALHITSSNFDEPQCIALLSSSSVVVTIHGEESRGETVYLGGLHQEAREVLRTALTENGYDVQTHTDPNLQGLQGRNICNIGRAGRGVQLELARGLRRTFFVSLTRQGRTRPTPRLAHFTNALRIALHQLKIE